MNKEETLLKKRLLDLSNMSYQRGIPVFTDFLSMNELSILHNLKSQELPTTYSTFGGYEFAERQMAMFVTDALFNDVPYPIATLAVRPKHPKFAQALSHRDYLGAMTNLGVERSKIGDIIVTEKEGYIFCQEKIAPFFCEELTQIKNTAVETFLCSVPDEIAKPEFTDIKATVSSLRVDCIVAMAVRKSRNSIAELFKSQKIFVNGKLILSGSHLLKENDIITVRGYGRFVFKEVLNVTKKDRLYILIQKY